MIVHFPGPLFVENISDRVDKLHESFTALVDDARLIVPVGFATDYASVPRIPFAYEMLGGIGKLAAVVHDYLYSSVCAPLLRARGRAWADEVFHAGLIEQRVAGWKAWLLWAAVRAAGGFFFQPLTLTLPAASAPIKGSAAAGAAIPEGVEVKSL